MARVVEDGSNMSAMGRHHAEAEEKRMMKEDAAEELYDALKAAFDFICWGKGDYVATMECVAKALNIAEGHKR